jgi:hypothetical protein
MSLIGDLSFNMMLPIRLIYVSNILGENRPLSPIIEPLELGDLEFFSPLTV